MTFVNPVEPRRIIPFDGISEFAERRGPRMDLVRVRVRPRGILEVRLG